MDQLGWLGAGVAWSLHCFSAKICELMTNYCALCAGEVPAAAHRCPHCNAPLSPHIPPVSNDFSPPASEPAPSWPTPTTIPSSESPAPPERRTIHNGQNTSLSEAARTAVRSLIQGDWLGAGQCAGVALLGLFCLAILGSAIFALIAGGVSPDTALRVVPSSIVAAAFGAHWKITFVDELFGTPLPDKEIGYQVIGFPLLITMIGILLLNRLVRFPRAGVINEAVLSRQLSQAVRIGILFGLGCLGLAELSTSHFNGGSAHANYLAAAGGGFIIATAVCASPALRSRFTKDPIISGRLREPIRAALAVFAGMTGLCLILVIIFLATGHITGGETGFSITDESDSATIFSFGLLFLPNIVWSLQGLLLGVPLTQHSALSPDTNHLWWFADLVQHSSWWLLTVPVTVGLLIAVGTVVAWRSPSPAVARSRVLATGVIVGLGNLLLLTFSQAALHLSFAPGTVTESIRGEIALSFLVPAALTMLAGLIGIGLVKLSVATRV